MNTELTRLSGTWGQSLGPNRMSAISMRTRNVGMWLRLKLNIPSKSQSSFGIWDGVRTITIVVIIIELTKQATDCPTDSPTYAFVVYRM